MFWTIIDRMVNLSFLLLAAILITILVSNSNEAASTSNFDKKVEVFQSEVKKYVDNVMAYTEGRVNKLQEQQDSYQNNTSARMAVIEEQMKLIQEVRKDNLRVINNNINNSSAVINK